MDLVLVSHQSQIPHTSHIDKTPKHVIFPTQSKHHGKDLTQKIYEDATAILYRHNNPLASANISNGSMFITVHTSSYAINPLGRGLHRAHNSSNSYKKNTMIFTDQDDRLYPSHSPSHHP